MEVSQKKLKIELPYDPTISLLGIYPKEMKTRYQRYCTPMLIAALFTIAKIWKQLTCSSIDEWIKKMCDIYIMEYFQTLKREIVPILTTGVDIEGILLSGINQTEDEHLLHGINYMWNLKNIKLLETE